MALLPQTVILLRHPLLRCSEDLIYGLSKGAIGNKLRCNIAHTDFNDLHMLACLLMAISSQLMIQINLISW